HPRIAGALSRFESERQLPSAATRARRDRGSPAIRATLLQRRGARLQHEDRDVSVADSRARGSVQGGGILSQRHRSGGARMMCVNLASRLLSPPLQGEGEKRRRSIASIGILVAMACIAIINVAHAEERILSFQSDITVAADASMEVAETIRVHAEGDQIRH